MVLNFAKRSLKLENSSKLLPLCQPKHVMNKRNPERCVVKTANTERFKRSAIPFLQRLLNEDYIRQKKDLSNLLQVNKGVVYINTQ